MTNAPATRRSDRRAASSRGAARGRGQARAALPREGGRESPPLFNPHDGRITPVLE